MKFSGLILANLFRKKARLVLTIGSFAVALFLFALLGVVSDAFGRGADIVSANRLVTINRTSIINTIPLSYRDEILRIPGVSNVTHDPVVARQAKMTLHLDKGVLVEAGARQGVAAGGV